ncbi:MAG: type II toxin-antitoxin system PemK/MazF family toxin [Tatlockia sp.]|nr:type II toxin-antitoxin system PemK/MazF family toxin [Tatlockia sp.]
MNRGDIYWVDLNPTVGSEINKLRPCVVIGATPINQARNTVVVIPLSTAAKARPPITITVSCLNKEVVALCDQIRAINKSRLKNQAGTLSEQDMNSINDGLRQVLCL